MSGCDRAPRRPRGPVVRRPRLHPGRSVATKGPLGPMETLRLRLGYVGMDGWVKVSLARKQRWLARSPGQTSGNAGRLCIRFWVCVSYLIEWFDCIVVGFCWPLSFERFEAFTVWSQSLQRRVKVYHRAIYYMATCLPLYGLQYIYVICLLI